MADIDAEVTEEERSVMRECVREAFWYRSLPAAAVTGEDPLHLTENSWKMRSLAIFGSA